MMGFGELGRPGSRHVLDACTYRDRDGLTSHGLDAHTASEADRTSCSTQNQVNLSGGYWSTACNPASYSRPCALYACCASSSAM